MKKASMHIGFGIALGAGSGAVLSMILGAGSAWLAVGIVVGIAIGAAVPRTTSNANDQRLTTND
jgi:predicted lysophospholipase L1 biosynthesis ABC-type transport system permease subunit